MRACFLALMTVLSVALGSTAGAVESWDIPDSKWRSGPVKYLLTREEDQAYKKLKTGEERAKFVEEFWARRDPDPSTPANKYRDEFYRLARDAAARFSEENGKGWQDDRGKVFILLGQPNDTVKGSSLLEAGSSPSSGIESPAGSPSGTGGYAMPGGEAPPQTSRKTIKFIYLDNPLTEKKGDRLELNFTGEVTGGFRLEEKIDWSHPLITGLAHKSSSAPAASPAQPPPATPVAPGTVPASSQPPAVPVPPAAPPPPVEATPQSDLIQQIKGAQDPAAAIIPLDVTVNFYKAAKGTFATLTLEVKKAALPEGADPAAMVVAAEILDSQTGESVQRFFKQEHFGGYEGNASAGAGDVLLYQAARPVNPGAYKAIFAVKDPASGAIGKLEKELIVPGYGEEELRLSTVTLARKVEPLVTAPAAGTPTPFVLGSFKVVPRPDNVFKEGEDLSFYFQIYGATPDPTTKAPKVDLSYGFEKSISGQWRMVGGKPLLTPGQSGLVQAFSLPLKSWPPGDYRVSIKVTDTVASPARTASAEVPFSILGASGLSKSKAKSKG